MNEEEKALQQDTQTGETQEDEQSSPSRQRSVFPYLAILFATAFLLLLFAYLMQQRDSQEIIGNLSDLRESMGSIQSIDQLVDENRALREEIERLKGEVAELDSARRLQNNEINALLEQADENKAALEAAQRRVRELELELAALWEESEMSAGGEE